MTEEVKQPTEGIPVEKPKEKTAETIEKIIGDTKEPSVNKPEGDSVPLATFLDVKKDARKFERELNDLKLKYESGDSTKKEMTDDLNALADEFDVDPKFVTKLVKIVESKSDQKVGEALKEVTDMKQELSKKQKDDFIDRAFTTHYNEAIERMPEYKEIANVDVIKALSLLPQNAKKTFPELIEETYGKAITGKRTIDPVKQAGGGKEPTALDMDRARKDTKYFEEVMGNPSLKAEYNKKMLEPRGRHS